MQCVYTAQPDVSAKAALDPAAVIISEQMHMNVLCLYLPGSDLSNPKLRHCAADIQLQWGN